MNQFKLETNFKDLNLGTNFTAAKDAFKNFKGKIEELKGFNKDGIFIHEYFSQLRNEIDIEREVVKLKIDQHYLKLVEEVDDFEEVCMQVSTVSNKSIENEVKISEEKLARFRNEFDKLEVNVDNWDNIRKGSNYQLKELNGKIHKLKNDLLMNQLYSFESNSSLIDVANKASKIIVKKSTIKKGKL
jgi:hypothetical protein